jgi:hypothetical protein
MVPRQTLIAVLIGIEVALLVGMIGAVRGGGPSLWPGFPSASAQGANAAPSWTFVTGPSPAVTIDIGHADLTIETRPGLQVAVSVVPGSEFNSSGQISARDEGGTIRILAANRDSSASMYMDERNVHVTVPPQTRVIVEEAGDIAASGLRADASFDSPNGGITISDFRGELTANSSDGHVEVSDADCATLRASSANGRVVLHRVKAGRLEASSSNGRVEATELAVRDGSVSSSNGRVSLHFAAGADTTVTASAANGDITIRGLAAAAAATGVASGDDDDDSVARTVRVGAGEGKLDVHASNGSIDLRGES